MKEFVIELLAKTLNMAPESVADKLFKKSEDGKTTLADIAPDALQFFLQQDADRLAKVKGEVDTKKIADDQYKRGQKEALDALEKAVRSEFKTDSTAQGLDLVKHIVSQAAQKKLGDDEVKVHPLFLALEAKAQKDATEAKATFEKQVAEMQAGFEKKERFSRATSDIATALDALRPVLPTNPAASASLRKIFLDQFTEFDFEPNPSGGWVVTKDGKRYENAHGHPVALAELVQQKAAGLFDFQKQDAKGNAGNGAPAGQQNGQPVAVPKTRQELDALLFKTDSPEERTKLREAFTASNPQPA